MNFPINVDRNLRNRCESEKWKLSRSIVSDSLLPHGLEPTMDWSLPWTVASSIHGIFQAKSTGVGCHCLLQPMTTEEFAKCDSRDFFFSFVSVCLVAQSCPTLCDLIDCSPPGSSVHGILQARILEWVAIPFSNGSSWPRNWTQVSCITDRFVTVWTTRKALCNYIDIC